MSGAHRELSRGGHANGSSKSLNQAITQAATLQVGMAAGSGECCILLHPRSTGTQRQSLIAISAAGGQRT